MDASSQILTHPFLQALCAKYSVNEICKRNVSDAELDYFIPPAFSHCLMLVGSSRFLSIYKGCYFYS